MLTRSAFALASCAAALAARASPEDAVIRSGVPWFDTDGNRIYAGGANLFLEDGTFYLVGEGKKVVSGDNSACFNFYKSSDLAAWDNLGCILNNTDIVSPPAWKYPYRMERPKIFKCPGAKSRPYRLVFHCDSPSFSMTSIGILTADAVTGPYTFSSPCFEPDGQPSYDMGTFVDDARGGDGKAYLIRSVRNQFAGISAFNDDCTNVTGIVSSGPDMEGQVIMRDENGTLHAGGSHLTGWSSNAAQFVTTSSKYLPGAQWDDNINPSGSPTTWDSQSTFIFPYEHADGHITFIWLADRWNANGPGGLDNMTNIWLPLIPPSGSNPPTKPVAGWLLQLATCDASDSKQQFSLAGSALTHSSGLCVAIPAGSGEAPQLELAACDPSDPAQTWRSAHGGKTIANDASGSCVDLNNDNNVLVEKNPIIAYQCGSPPAWNEEWSVGGGLLTAIDQSGSKSSFCASVGPASDPTQWSLPWRAEWSLKDY
jgi:hypothetical protein